jgi:hypothetical protein
MPTLSELAHDQALLVVTHGQDLTLQWNGPSLLRVICSNCGISKIDVMDKRADWKSIKIDYVGFPGA